MTDKIRKIIDKYFWAIFIGFIFAIFFVLFLMVKGVMASTTQCEFSNPINLVPSPSPADFEYSKQTCTTTDVFSTTSPDIIETWDINFNGTTSKLYFTNSWTAGDVLIVFSMFCFAVFYIAKTIIKIFVKKYVSIKRLNQ
jgi:hypothetical protein